MLLCLKVLFEFGVGQHPFEDPGFDRCTLFEPFPGREGCRQRLLDNILGNAKEPSISH